MNILMSHWLLSIYVQITAATEVYVYQVSKTTNDPVVYLFISINSKRVLLCPCFFINIQGNCTCDYGFGGSDCSFDVLSPPTINKLSGDGVCDKSSERCEDSTVYGYYFLENMGTTCHVTREEVIVVKMYALLQ